MSKTKLASRKQIPAYLTFILLGIILLAAGVAVHTALGRSSKPKLADDAPPPAPTPASKRDLQQLPSNNQAFPGTVLIADRGNNRLIEVNPAKKIVWQLNFNDLIPGLKPGFGADDAFFTPDGKDIMVNLEEYHMIAEIDYQTKQIVWEYGHPNQPGHANGFLNTPDDAYMLPDGLVSVADIKNCRILFLNQQRQIVHQFGQTGVCRKDKPGFYSEPNGDTPLLNGDTLISIIKTKEVAEVRPDGSEVFRIKVPVQYPSDAQLLANGDILVASYTKKGTIVELTKTGQIVWQYFFPDDPTKNLDQPSLAIQLPDGNIMTNDDYNHRVIVIDYKTKNIIWQYGVTGKPGSADGQLNIPDGINLHVAHGRV